MDARYKDFPNGGVDPITGAPVSYSGNRLPNALAVRLRGDYTYLGKQYYNSAQSEIICSGAGYGLLNARVGVGDPGERWTVSVWARNLANKKHITEVTDWSFEGAAGRYFGEMRPFGVDFTTRFGR